MGYVPAGPDRERAWFDVRVRYYSRLDLSLSFFGLEDEFSAASIADLLTCDAIHLTGGNTFRFLHWLRVRGLVSLLERYVAQGGVLIGVSAGAILMTRDVGSAALCGDSPYRASPITRNCRWSILVCSRTSTRRALMSTRFARPSAELGNAAYGIADGAGIVVDGARVDLIGSVAIG